MDIQFLNQAVNFGFAAFAFTALFLLYRADTQRHEKAVEQMNTRLATLIENNTSALVSMQKTLEVSLERILETRANK